MFLITPHQSSRQIGKWRQRGGGQVDQVQKEVCRKLRVVFVPNVRRQRQRKEDKEERQGYLLRAPPFQIPALIQKCVFVSAKAEESDDSESEKEDKSKKKKGKGKKKKVSTRCYAQCFSLLQKLKRNCREMEKVLAVTHLKLNGITFLTSRKFIWRSFNQPGANIRSSFLMMRDETLIWHWKKNDLANMRLYHISKHFCHWT